MSKNNDDDLSNGRRNACGKGETMTSKPAEPDGYGAGIVLGFLISLAFWAVMWWVLQ